MLFRSRALIFASVLALSILSADTLAAKDKPGKNKNGNGPAFCRNGQGHPRWGWQWCEDRGWDRSGNRVVLRDRNGRILENGRVADNGRADRRVTAGRSYNAAFDRGYDDGYQKGIEDSGKNRSFDPTRHAWYRSADRGYDSQYGTKAQYQNLYRDGFRDGYDEGFRDRDYNEGRTTSSSRGGSTGTGTAIPRRWPY